MKIEDGPAAVTGITTCIMPLTFCFTLMSGRRREYAIRKSEDLPEQYTVTAVEDYQHSTDLVDTKGNPQV